MAHQPIKPRTYVLIYVALLLLTGLTVLIATNQDTLQLRSFEVPIALGIASAKTLLVAIFFMHLIHSRPLTWVVILTGVLFLALMIGITLSDYWTRGWMPVRGPLPPASWLGI
jgi:cytochrome c oxidase subunit 4